MLILFHFFFYLFVFFISSSPLFISFVIFLYLFGYDNPGKKMFCPTAYEVLLFTLLQLLYHQHQHVSGYGNARHVFLSFVVF